MFSDERIRRLTLAPNLDFLSASQAEIVAALLDDLLKTDFDPSKIHPQLPSLVARIGSACASPEDASRMVDELERWVRWYRLPGFWLTYLFQLSMAQQHLPVACAIANFLYAEAQINLNSDLSLSSLENGYLALVGQDDAIARQIAAVIELRMRTIFNYYRRLYSAIPYKQVNPLTVHLYSRKTWTDLLDVFPELRKPLDEIAPAEYLSVIDLCVKSGNTYTCVLTRRFLGSAYEARNQLREAAQQFDLALKDAEPAALDTEIGHLHRLHGYVLRNSGHLDEAEREFSLAYDHESHPLFAYWRALSARELGDIWLRQLPRSIDRAHLPEKPLQEAMRWYQAGRDLFERQVVTCVLPVARAVEQQMFRSYADNSLEIAVLAGPRDTIAEAEASGPRFATDVVAEDHAAAAALDPVAHARYSRSRAIFQEHLATFNQGDAEADFQSYLSSIERNREERRFYVHTRLQLAPKITGAQLSDEIAARLFDLRLPNVAFLLMHVASQQTFMGLLFPGVTAKWMEPAKIEAVRWQECDQAFQSTLQNTKSPPSLDPAPAMRSALDTLLPVYEECFRSFLESSLPDLQGNQLKVFPRFSANAVPFHALKVKGSPLIKYCDVSYGQTLGMFLQIHRESPSLDPGTLGVVDAGILPFRGTFRMLDAARNDGVYRLPNSSWEDVRTAISDRHVSDLFFACHGEYDRDDPAKSRLFLSGHERVVSFSEIFSRLDLTGCRSVTLGACESGIARTLVSAEYIGLPLAFLAAGAQYVIGTLWQVNQYAAAILLGHYHQFLGDGKHTVVNALNEAQRVTMRMSQADVNDWLTKFLPEKAQDLEPCVRRMQDPPFAHPYYWAGFYVAGDV
jgi:tetratricopeptide (TPR) repeat protein